MAAVAALVLGVPQARATESFQQTSVTLGYGFNSKYDPVFGYGTDDKKLAIGQVEHYGVWEYGDNYFDFEVYHGKGVGNIPAFSAAGFHSGSFADQTKLHYLGVYNNRLSMAKLTGTSFAFGPIKDVYPTVRLEVSDYANFHAVNPGVSFDLAVPGFAFFETAFYARYDRFTGDTRQGANLFWRTFAIAPFTIARLEFTFAPFLTVNFRKDDRGVETYFRPDVWLKVGDTPIDVGFRPEWHTYKRTAAEGGGRYSRVTPIIMARWRI